MGYHRIPYDKTQENARVIAVVWCRIRSRWAGGDQSTAGRASTAVRRRLRRYPGPQRLFEAGQEIDSHTSRDAPERFAVVVVEKDQRARLRVARVGIRTDAAVGVLAEPGERDAEDPGDLPWVGYQGLGPGDAADHGCDQKPADGEHGSQLSKDEYAFRGQSNLFLCLAQRGGDAVGVSGLSASAGKSDLTAVQVMRALSTADVHQVPGTLQSVKRQQDGRSLHRFARGTGQFGDGSAAARRREQPCMDLVAGEAVEREGAVHPAGPIASRVGLVFQVMLAAGAGRPSSAVN